MLFNSLEFGIFLCAVLGLYALLPHRAQNRMLLGASYLFYAAWDWRFLGLILISTILDYLVALRLGRVSGQRARRGLLALSVLVNLGILGGFKYAGFFSQALADLAGHLGIRVPGVVLDVALPVGISFYTFQTVSYTIDVYRGRLQPTADFLDFALFVSFFPQLVAGPIERARHLLPQISGARNVTLERLGSGTWLILWGTVKKVVIADNLAVLVDAVYTPGAGPTGAQVILATYAFAVQIYCDFSGYTDVARGAARLMGFDLMVNFHLPYLATSPADFWRRWHISLSTWLRDYLYVPLGGNRAGAARTYRNLLITMVLGGLWHGAAWTFILWGAYHGVLLTVHRALGGALAKVAPRSSIGRRLWLGGRVTTTFNLVCLGWLVFRAESVTHLGELLRAMAGPLDPGSALAWLGPLAILVAPLVLVQIGQVLRRDQEFVVRLPLAIRTVVYVVLFAYLVGLGEDFGNPFIYFQF
jgi:D-alanyl-lipoteichoic acid acyltransferase DltB (MBOAT superfamily)